jgi:antitoxin MazE
MKLARWGNSLAIRIPAEVVEKLKLEPGEEIEVKVTGDNQFEVSRDRRRQEALEKLRRLRITVPEDYVFDRDEIYDS